MNTGIDLEKEELEQLGTEWQFGALTQPGLATIPESDREEYLPKGEMQKGVEDFLDCVSRGYNNSLETQFNYLYRNNKLKPENKKWLEDKGYVQNNEVTFSDRFVAILSGTTKRGNSLRAPIDTIRKQGLTPKSLLPKEENMTWDMYHDPSKVTDELKQLGQDFLRRFSINYEQVPNTLMSESVKDDIIVVAGYGWPTPIDGVYPAQKELPLNHCWINFKNRYFAFDNYLDNGSQEDWIKHLSESYHFYIYGYRAYISAEYVPVSLEDVSESQRAPLFTWLAQMIAWITTKQGPMPEIPKEVLPEKPTEKPKIDLITKFAKAIERHEGYYPGSRSYRNNNPANAKYIGQYASAGEDKDGFAIFPSYLVGFDYLCRVLRNACEGKSRVYSPDMDLFDFFETYAPYSDGNNPAQYANTVAKEMGVLPLAQLKTFI